MNKFKDTTEEIIKISEGYEDSGLRNMFLDTFVIFLEVAQNLSTGKLSTGAEGESDDGLTYEGVDSVTDTKIKLQVFEKMFNIDLEAEMAIAFEEFLNNGGGSVDSDVANADTELLDSIRSNFDKYLKD